MDNVVREAKDKGFVETLFHRRRELPDINSRNFNVRNFAERTAINSPIQGSAADILKIAMINLDKALVEGGYNTKMLLQVHDEIVLEVPNDELVAMKALVKETMEAAVELAVPLIADENDGRTWYEAKLNMKENFPFTYFLLRYMLGFLAVVLAIVAVLVLITYFMTK